MRPNCRIPLLLSFLAVLLVESAAAQEYLRVLDPQRTWMSEQGTIEEAVLSVHPKGVYMEYGLYLTFSARGTQFANSSVPLEVEFFFELPDQAVVTDSWLWIEEEIIRATIMDQWTASSIYEEVVNRQRDPSILFKRGQGRYELRIYPMAGNAKRKVKLTFLLPADWTASRVASDIPASLLRTSRYPLNKVHVLTWPSNKWSAPGIDELPGVGFVEMNDAFFGSYLQATLPAAALNGSITFSVDAPLTEGVFVSSVREGAEGWYQMALLPSLAIEGSSGRRVAFVIDYDASRTNVGRSVVLSSLRAQVLSSFSAADSFNVFFSRLDVHRVSDRWLPADAATVDSVFSQIIPDQIGTYSSLPAVLASAIGFIDDGAPASVMLLSSSDQFGNVDVGNQIIADLRASTERMPPIHIADFADRNLNTYWVGGQSFIANSYLFTNLAKLSGGSYLTMRSPTRSFAELIVDSFEGLRGFLNAFDLHTTLENGFCFGRFNMHANDEAVAADQPVLQIGRFYGDFPFVADMSGMYQSQPFSQRSVVPAEEVYQSDSTLVSLWAGRQIQTLEVGPQTNDVINEVINYSLDQRVLSLYTAFLALEPSRGGEVCYSCVDESAAVPIERDETPESESESVTAYPNPFRDQVTIEVQLSHPVEAAQVRAAIYNVMGQRVRELTVSGGIAQSFTLQWDGTDASGRDLASGTYFFVLQTPAGRYTLSLVKAG